MSNTITSTSSELISSHIAFSESYWEPYLFEQVDEHRYSVVFPRRSEKWLQRKANQYSEHGQDEPVVLANDTIIAGRDNIAICTLADIKVRVLNLGEQSEANVKSYVTTINTFCNNVSRREKRLAAESLYIQSNGSLTIDEASQICGVSTYVVAIDIATNAVMHAVNSIPSF